MSNLRRATIILPLILLALLGGCREVPVDNSDAEHTRTWKCRFYLCDTCKVKKAERRLKPIREQKLKELREQISPVFFVGAITYTAFLLIGPSVTEKFREKITLKFQIPISVQVSMALVIWIVLVVGTLIFSLINQNIRSILPAILVILSATAVPFFLQVLPSLKEGDKQKRKAAVSQIKSFLMLIFIFYVILAILSPEGFLGIKIW